MREEPLGVDAPPSSVVKCLWEVFVWGFGVLFLSCVCVGGVVLCRCVCDLLIFSHLIRSQVREEPLGVDARGRQYCFFADLHRLWVHAPG